MQMVKLACTVFLEENCTFILHCEQRKFELHYSENKIIMIKVSKRCAKSAKPLILSNVFLSVLYLIE